MKTNMLALTTLAGLSGRPHHGEAAQSHEHGHGDVPRPHESRHDVDDVGCGQRRLVHEELARDGRARDEEGGGERHALLEKRQQERVLELPRRQDRLGEEHDHCGVTSSTKCVHSGSRVQERPEAHTARSQAATCRRYPIVRHRQQTYAHRVIPILGGAHSVLTQLPRRDPPTLSCSHRFSTQFSHRR